MGNIDNLKIGSPQFPGVQLFFYIAYMDPSWVTAFWNIIHWSLSTSTASASSLRRIRQKRHALRSAGASQSSERCQISGLEIVCIMSTVKTMAFNMAPNFKGIQHHQKPLININGAILRGFSIIKKTIHQT